MPDKHCIARPGTRARPSNQYWYPADRYSARYPVAGVPDCTARLPTGAGHTGKGIHTEIAVVLQLTVAACPTADGEQALR